MVWSTRISYYASVEWNGSNQTPPTPNIYNPSHIYSFPFVEDGSVKIFSLLIMGYGDNSGSLSFSIYHITFLKDQVIHGQLEI